MTRRRAAGVAILLALALPASRAAAQAPPGAPTPARADTTLPRVLVIATGGTIAGVQDAPGTLGGYRAGTLTAEQLVAGVPELARHARVEAEQFSNVASTSITPAMWVGLARRINAVLRERPELAGVVVTHGTDRLEETAFFLYLAVRSDKPVAVVGAQRPATGISPDGPMNLLSAVRTVASPQATGKGVLVVMDERILSAREVRKQYQRVGGFDGGEMGMLGVVTAGGPEFYFAPTRRRGAASEFDLAGVDSLPRVELVYSYPGGTGPTFATPPVGVVVTTTGFAPTEAAAFRALREQGVVLVTAFPSGDNATGAPRTGGGGAPPRPDSAAAPAAAPSRPLAPSIAAQHLTPQKARILLMLALTHTRDGRELQRIFREY